MTEDIDKAGIYIITSKTNNSSYIGQAVSFYKRWAQHRSALKCGTHHSSYLQNTYNKYGSDDIVFEILEVVEDISKLNEREQWYLDNTKCDFNTYKIAGSPLGCKQKNAKYISFNKRTDKYKIAYRINGKSYSFGQYDSLEKANECLEYILSLSDEDKLQHYNENHNKKLNRKGYCYDKTTEKYIAYRDINSKSYTFGRFKTEAECIKKVEFVYSLSEDEAYDYYLKHHIRKNNFNGVSHDKRSNTYYVMRSINNKHYHFGTFKDESIAKAVGEYVFSLPKPQALLFHANRKYVDFHFTNGLTNEH